MKAYEFYHDALLRLLATLFVAAGIVEGGAGVATLPRLVRNKIQRLLLPIESAVRRIIFYRAQRIDVPPVKEKKKRQSRLSKHTLEHQKKNRRDERRRRAKEKKTSTIRAVVFWLFDKERYDPNTSDPNKRPRHGGRHARISWLDGYDAPREPEVEKPVRDPNDATKLCRRMQAVMGALRDIDGQALRLRRLLDKRKAAAEAAKSRPSSRPAKPARTNPLREGFAPGYRPEQTQEVDEWLFELDYLARRPAPPTV